VSARLRCSACQAALPVSSPHVECPCGGLLEVEHSLPYRSTELRKRFDRRRGSEELAQGSGVWRFKELLLPGHGPLVSHPEGNTPLYRREPLSRFAGVADLALKHEGENPTGSFKDRGMTVAITQAARRGAGAVACASTGNTSASMAAYAAQAGLPALVFVPAGRVAAGKLAQALAYGARTLLVRTDFDGCLRLVRQVSEALGVTLLNSVNPWRIEGQKTVVLELLQQRGWTPPDWIVVPAGNLGNTAAFGKALREARSLGLIRKLPRVASIQATGANPFYRSFRSGFERRFRVRAETVATAIRIGDPASHDRAVRTIRETRGLVDPQARVPGSHRPTRLRGRRTHGTPAQGPSDDDGLSPARWAPGGQSPRRGRASAFRRGTVAEGLGPRIGPPGVRLVAGPTLRVCSDGRIGDAGPRSGPTYKRLADCLLQALVSDPRHALAPDHARN